MKSESYEHAKIVEFFKSLYFDRVLYWCILRQGIEGIFVRNNNRHKNNFIYVIIFVSATFMTTLN
jgi:hypothetical protein